MPAVIRKYDDYDSINYVKTRRYNHKKNKVNYNDDFYQTPSNKQPYKKEKRKITAQTWSDYVDD